ISFKLVSGAAGTRTAASSPRRVMPIFSPSRAHSTSSESFCLASNSPKGAAVWEALVGNGAAARRAATEGLGLSKKPDIEYAASFALAVSGDFSRSQPLTKDLEEQFPDDTSVRFSYLPVLRGLFALHRNEPDAAIEQLRIAAPYELAQSRIGF